MLHSLVNTSTKLTDIRLFLTTRWEQKQEAYFTTLLFQQISWWYNYRQMHLFIWYSNCEWVLKQFTKCQTKLIFGKLMKKLIIFIWFPLFLNILTNWYCNVIEWLIHVMLYVHPDRETYVIVIVITLAKL